MPRRQAVFLTLFLAIVWLLLISVLHNNLASDPQQFIRWFNDPNDRLAYMQDGAWLPSGQVPYREVKSE